MYKPQPYFVMVFLCILALVVGECTESSEQTMAATPLEVSKEASPGEYIEVRLQLSSEQPCKLILASVAKTEIDNYLSPYTAETLTYPDNNKIVVWHEQIPFGTLRGSYILKVFQMMHDGDTEGKEIFSQSFMVR